MGASEPSHPPRSRANALLERYGGENGPTGHASAGNSCEPVSLSSFIGGQAKAAPLGKLEGDGRTYTGDSTPDDFQRLPGLAKEGSLASFLAKREQELHPELSPAATSEAAVTQEVPAADGPNAPAPEKPAPSSDEKKTTPPLHRSTTGKEIVVLISGSGSNLQALIDATCGDSPRIPGAHIGRVISNRKNAYGLERAKNVNPAIPTVVHSLKTYQTRNPGKTRDDYDLVLAEKVLGDGRVPDLVVLAGFMHIVSETFLSAMGHATSLAEAPATVKRPAHPVPVINLHPALPGTFDGTHAIERAYEAFQAGKIEHTGVMVHEVVAEVDRGAPILVRPVPIVKDELLEDLETRMHAVEHEILVAAVADILSGARTLTTSTVPPPKATQDATTFLRLDAQGHWIPIAQPLIVYEDDVVWVRGTSSVVWLGRHAKRTIPGDAQACVQRGSTEHQGLESAVFLRAVGGLLATMLGARDSKPADHRLFIVRSDVDGTWIDEVPVCAASLCTAFSAVLVTPQGVHVWHGVGSDDVQQQRAVEWARGLAPMHHGIDTAALLALVDGHEMADGWHHRHHAALPPDVRQAQLYAPALEPTAVPFAWARVSSAQVSIIDARLEIYVVVGANARGDRAALVQALDRAEALAAAHVRGAPMRAPVHVLEAPSLVPLDLHVLARDPWNEHISTAGAVPNSLVLMNVRSLAEARAALAEEGCSGSAASGGSPRV